MILLVLVTIYIYRKFAELAVQKNVSKSRWGFIGAAVYLGFGLGLQFFVGVMVALGWIELDIEDMALNFVLSIVSYAVGGIAAYVVYQKLESMPDENPDIDNFGKPQQDNDR